MIETVTLPEGQNGPWTIRKFEVPKSSLENLRLWRDGRGCLPGRYTQLVHAKRGIVMSDTTAEQEDHWGFVRAARESVIINGLGIGMCLKAVLRKESVSHVTVVEIDKDLIDLVWPHYACDRATIINASAFDYTPPKDSHFGAVWHDIWDDICEDNRPEMVRLHRKFGRFADWQGSWGRSRMDLEKIRNRRNRYW